MSNVLEVDGFCPVCETRTVFASADPWLRDHFACANCESRPRERALIAVLNMYFPEWRTLAVHESSPALRASAKLKRECPGYVASQYDRSVPFGAIHGEHRSEDLESQTFPDACFDLVITQDVFEHLFRPDRAIAEIARTLRPGGAHVCTVPIGRRSTPSIRRARLREDGSIEHLMEPIYHGNPMDDAGSLVTVDYGYDIAEYLDLHGGLNTTIVFIDDLSRGIRAEFIEVLVSRKPAGPPSIDDPMTAGPAPKRRRTLLDAALGARADRLRRLRGALARRLRRSET